MAILHTSNLSQSFGAVDVFTNITASIPNDGKIGLVGPNGIGKTSLLLILAGQAPPSSGSVQRARNCRLGYLPQESASAFVGQMHTVYEEMLTLFAGLREQEEKLRQMERTIADGDDSAEMLSLYGAALERFEQAGGYTYELRIKQTLTGLGFDGETRHLPLTHLSGGQKTRALLARLLLEQPDLLVLDEPTNHLDIEAVEWLESALKAWSGALLVVSHDRYFLDNVVNRIWEMGRSGIEVYRGNYSHYVQQRQERWDRRQKEFTAFQERMEKELDYIRRNIAGQNTLQAQGKLKRLTRELKAFHAGGLPAVQDKNWSQTLQHLDITAGEWGVAEATEALRTLPLPQNRPPQLNLRLTTTQRSGELVLRSEELAIGYPGNLLFRAEDIELRRQEVAALIGPNGTGKTTLLRTIMGELPPLWGQIRLGASLKVGYFAQAHERLDTRNTVIDELIRHHPMPLSEARHHLARYLLRGEDVYKLVGMLSGGERGRLALAVLALEGANFLLLDEPTNHLDIPAQEVLQEVLENFDGTILMVSHDRYLVNRLATQIWNLADGCLQVFKGPYQEFVAQRDAANEAARDAAREVAQAQAARTERPGQGLSKNARQQRIKALAELEEQITILEGQSAHLVEALQAASVAQDFDKIQNLSIEYSETQHRLEHLMQEWEDFVHEQ